MDQKIIQLQLTQDELEIMKEALWNYQLETDRSSRKLAFRYLKGIVEELTSKSQRSKKHRPALGHFHRQQPPHPRGIAAIMWLPKCKLAGFARPSTAGNTGLPLMAGACSALIVAQDGAGSTPNRCLGASGSQKVGCNPYVEED